MTRRARVRGYRRALVACLLGAALHPAAQAAPNQSPFDIRLEVDLPIIGATALGAMIPELLKGRLSGASCLPLCDASAVWSLDRAATAYHSDALSVVSDVLVAGIIAFPLVLGALDVLVNRPVDGWRGFGKDAVVVSEVLTVELLLAALARFTVRRPRPLVYNASLPLAQRADADNTLSFYSGHAGSAFALAIAGSLVFARRHPKSPWRYVVWATSLAAAALTASLRVAAGRHFPSDVLAGSAIGAGVGLVVPWLHFRGE